MIIAGIYSFNRGEDIIRSQYPTELHEVEQVIAAVDGTRCKTKIRQEKTMPGRTLYSPRALNRAFTKEFEMLGWEKHKVQCDYPTQYLCTWFCAQQPVKGGFSRNGFRQEQSGDGSSIWQVCLHGLQRLRKNDYIPQAGSN